jgi:glycosyltransferase involved in cell wall biosynthesis
MVTPSYFPIKGGAETVIRTMARGLNRIDVKTDIMTFNMEHKWVPHYWGRTETTGDPRITVIRIPGFNWLPIAHSIAITQGINLIPWNFRRILENYDIIHFHSGDLTLPFFSIGVRKPKLIQFHGPLSSYKETLVSKTIIRKTADGYIAISRTMEEELRKLGIPNSRINYLPNAIDTELFQPLGEKTENLVIYVGRVTRDKGLHVLLSSLKMIKNNIHLAIIGPADYDTDYFAGLKKLISKENERGVHRITCIGEQEEEEVADWCQRASLLVLPSFREASSVVSLEALSCKTPVVATNVGGVPEIVRDGETGLLVPPRNDAALARSIEYLLGNKELRSRFGEKGRKLVLEKFSSQVSVKRLLEIYKSVLK